jgi:Family of unknown function (DUF5682)
MSDGDGHDRPPSEDRVHLLGIRHHGPGSARSVLRALETIGPEAVLVELPADLEPALRWIGEDGLDPPVALLGYAVADPGRAVFAPFGVFSPEWQAIDWANEHGIAVRAIDLPLAVTLSNDAAADGGAPDDLFGERAPPDPLRDLAAAAGEPDPERWWEDVIEHRGDGPHAFDAVAAAMAAVRIGFVPSRRERQREAHMRRAIRVALRDTTGPVVVVCGAWHVPALHVSKGDRGANGVGDHTATSDAAELRGLVRVKVGAAWVPWTHRRLASASGYSAGVDSPGWYRHVFEHPGAEGVARFFVEIAALLRQAGLGASPDDLIAGTRLATALATLRSRPRPGLAEVLDAADAVMGNVDLIRRSLVVGDVIGTVPQNAPQVPLARDLARLQKSARLAPAATTTTLELDVRTTNGMRRSTMLHRLLALGVPWGIPEEGRGTSGTFRETWRLSWEPELSIRLVERAGYGTTLESASTAHLIERAERTSGVIDLIGVLDRALLAQLPTAVEPALRRLAKRAATDPDVGHLMDAVGPLANAMRYGDVRGTEQDSLRVLFDEFVERILAGTLGAFASLDDVAAALAVERLSGVQAALAIADHPARSERFPQVLTALATSRSHGLVCGRATRLLHDSGVWAPADVERRLSLALTPGTPAAVGASFVEGFLAGSGTVLVHDRELLGVVDVWLSSLTGDAFDGVVALLRRTFGSFESAERRQIMTLLMSGRSIRTDVFGSDVDPERAAAALVTVRHLLGLPAHDPQIDSQIDSTVGLPC